jgi:hypothetical protein
MITTEKIQRGGSKLEITREILESGLDLPVPVSAWRYYGNDLAPLEAAFQRMKKPVIVRGSHKNDYHGFIDVVPTLNDVMTIHQLEKAVKIIESEVQSEEVQIHCADWQQPFTPEVHILMQEQSPSPLNGSMLRHPHKKEGYYVQYRNMRDIERWRNPVSYARQNIPMEDFFQAESHLGVSEDEVKQAISMFQKLEASGVLEKDWAYQVEFGLEPLMFFQARPFKKIEPALSFEIPAFENAVESYDAFGITPPEGVELEFLVCTPSTLFNKNGFNQQRKDLPKNIGIYQSRRFEPGDSPAKGLRVGNLMCFYSPCSFDNFLFHENYRFMKQAEVSFLRSVPHQLYQNFRARIISNGDSGAIIPIN